MTAINLICMLTMAVGATVFMGVHRYGTFEIDREKKIPEEKLRQANRDSTKLFVAKIISIVIAGISVALFFIKEDVSESVIIYNEDSVIHCILIVLFFCVVIFGNIEAKKTSVIVKDKEGSIKKDFFLE